MSEKPTILVVDDDLPILTLMRSLLREFGFDPVTAIDREPSAVRSALRNAGANAVAISAVCGDLIELLPASETLVANVPEGLIARLAGAVRHSTRRVVASGFHCAESADLVELWAARGFALRRRLDLAGWSALLLERPS